MKKTLLNLLVAQIIASVLFISVSIPFQSCEPDDQECDTCGPVAYKPNIYLYPTETTVLDIRLRFPLGGKIISSIPDYGNGWSIEVDSSGIINNRYEYLFYESKQPDVWQKKYGWIIKRAELEPFFRGNMLKHGFNGKEIQDFTAYWIPRLTDFEYYEIYPQESAVIGRVVKLEISSQPDNILRLFYLIKGVNSDSNNSIELPAKNTAFKRNGFFVTEWGVLL
jgi:hypothetical protein